MGGIEFYFTSSPKYLIPLCTSWMDFPTELPNAKEKIWRITKTQTSESILLQIHCNDVELLNLSLSDSTCNGDKRWKKYWPRKVNAITFNPFTDNASDFYRSSKSGKYLNQCYGWVGGGGVAAQKTRGRITNKTQKVLTCT